MTWVRRLLSRRIVAELATFGVIGMICLIADIGLFNLFAFVAGIEVVLAKCMGLVITGLMAFFGHRNITFRHRHGGGRRREVSTFVAATVATVVLSLLPLYVTRNVIGVSSVLALNVANLFGIVLGTVARYAAYRWFVWRNENVPDVVTVLDIAASSGSADSARDLVAADRRRGRALQVQDELVGE